MEPPQPRNRNKPSYESTHRLDYLSSDGMTRGACGVAGNQRLRHDHELRVMTSLWCKEVIEQVVSRDPLRENVHFIYVDEAEEWGSESSYASALEGARVPTIMSMQGVLTIGNDAFVGANAIILKGVVIGDRSIVAAGSVVFRGNYPSDCIISGNPATISRSKNPS